MADEQPPMTPDEPGEQVDEAMGPDAERFEHYLDALLSGERPSPDDVADRDEAEMARLAAELSAALDPEDEPDAAFLEQLRLRMRHADGGIASVKEPLPLRPDAAPGPAISAQGRVRVTRRQLLAAGMIGAAGVTAGVAAGAAGAAVFRREPAQRDWIWDDGSGLVGEDDGEWVQVAMVSDVMTNNAVRFSTPAFDGWVVNDDGEIRALGAVCTHMGCSLRFRPQWKDLRCPCHGASFDLTGALANGRSRWRTDGPYLGDDKAYPIALPDLVKPAFKVQYGRVWIWTAKSTRTTT